MVSVLALAITFLFKGSSSFFTPTITSNYSVKPANDAKTDIRTKVNFTGSKTYTSKVDGYNLSITLPPEYLISEKDLRDTSDTSKLVLAATSTETLLTIRTVTDPNQSNFTQEEALRAVLDSKKDDFGEKLIWDKQQLKRFGSNLFLFRTGSAKRIVNNQEVTQSNRQYITFDSNQAYIIDFSTFYPIEERIQDYDEMITSLVFSK